MTSRYDALREKLRAYLQHFRPNHAGRKNGDLHQVAEHVWFLGCTSYCILLENGHALIWDYGYVPHESIQTLKRDHGLKHVDAVAISHYHDDHVARIHELVYRLCRSSPRVEVWAFENQADIYADPTRFNIPCLWPTPTLVDRLLAEDEVVDWHGVHLQFFHMPGQTEWHCGMVADIAGKRFAFTGDNVWKPDAADERPPNGPVIWRNQQFIDGGTLKGFNKLQTLAPDVILPAHTDPIDPVTTEYFDALLGWAEQIEPMMSALIDQPDPEFGCDHRYVWAAEVVLDGVDHGERAEMIIDVE